MGTGLGRRVSGDARIPGAKRQITVESGGEREQRRMRGKGDKGVGNHAGNLVIERAERKGRTGRTGRMSRAGRTGVKGRRERRGRWDGQNGRDGRDGRGGRDGRDGRDVRLGF